jgi:hypothetical protein
MGGASALESSKESGRRMTLDRLSILDVWTALGGGELRHGRGRAFWRDGDGYSISLNADKGAWYDFRDNRGGGLLALVEQALNCDRSQAIDWLQANCGLDERKLTPAQRRERAELLRRADELGQRFADFYRGLSLAAHRLAVLNEALIIAGADGPEILASHHRAAYLLERATADDIARLWRNSPEERDAIESIGRADREQSDAITNALVRALSELQETVAA